MAAEPHFRASSRRPLSLPATVSAQTGGPKAARLVNLGLGGACVEVQSLLEVGATVTLRVSAPNLWDPLIVPARVAWSRPGKAGMSTVAGVAFDHAEKAALPAILELLVAYRFE
jgi:Tfp pilus assembly protein PilZ